MLSFDSEFAFSFFHFILMLKSVPQERMTTLGWQNELFISVFQTLNFLYLNQEGRKNKNI
jgi:hypothetical protein